jgi:uncharacterized lipoprotein YbaY
MTKLWLALAAVLLLAACASTEAPPPAPTDEEKVAADPNAVTVTTSGSVKVGVKSSSR